MPPVQTAESSTPKKRTSKVVDHLEIHPQLGGGHIVKHVYSGYEHDPKEVKFNKAGKSQGGEHVIAHLTKQAGLPAMTSAEGNGESPTEEELD
jgi:hypothetical protein